MANLAAHLELRRAANRPDDLDAGPNAEASDDAPQVMRHCGAGASTVTIDQWGNVLPCVQWRREVGNIRETPFPEIWEKSTGLADVRQITVEAKETARSFQGPKAVVFFCPGMAELLTGDPLTLYPATPAASETAIAADDIAEAENS
jgi:hypothetical protein